MPIIQAGLSTNVPLSAGSILTVTPYGQATTTVTVRAVSGGAILQDQAATSQALNYGSFSQDANVDIDAIGGAVNWAIYQPVLYLQDSASATGAGNYFAVNGATRVQCSLSQASGTVAQAIVQLESSSGAVLGIVYYPQGTPRWIDLPSSTSTIRRNVITLTGSSPGLGMVFSV